MDPGHHSGGIQAAHNQAAQAQGEREQGLDASDDPVLNGHEDGANDGIRQVAGDKYAGQGRYKQVEHGGNDLVQAFFNEAHHPHGDDHRNDVALILLQQIKIGKRRVAEEAGHERRMMLQFAHE